MSSHIIRIVKQLLVVSSAFVVVGVAASTASATGLSNPDGFVTTSNTPNLAWTGAPGETTTAVAFSSSATVDATGAFTAPTGTLTSADFTIDAAGNGSLTNWANTETSPLWPGTYYWHVGYTVAATATAPEQHLWTPARKLVVKRVFVVSSIKDVEGTTIETTLGAKFSLTYKVKTNLQVVPMHLLVKLNGHKICAMSAPLKHVGKLSALTASETTTCTLRASYYHFKGTNKIVQSGTLGSKATTGKAVPLNFVSTFKL